MLFECPSGNLNPEAEPVYQGGDYGLKCRICGMEETALEDMDPEPGYIWVKLRFGPNANDGIIEETDIAGYGIFEVDECNRRIGDVVAFVPKVDMLYEEQCCVMDFYEVDISMVLPENVTSTTFMVVPNTTRHGFLTSGFVTEIVSDRVFNGSSPRPVPRHSDSRRAGAPEAIALLVALGLAASTSAAWREER